MRLRLPPFPNPVDERSARLVAAGVLVLAGALVAGAPGWLTVPLASGFAARVAFGPRVSPLAVLVTRVVVPRLPGPPRYTPGPPKRFAQAIGAALATVSLAGWLAGAPGVVRVAAGAIAAAAFLEAAFGLCLGCRLFALAMRAGLVPERVCLESVIAARPAAGRG